MNNSEIAEEEYHEHRRPLEFNSYGGQCGARSKFDFMTKMFSSKKKKNNIIRMRSPPVRRIHRVKTLSPQRQGQNIFMVAEGDGIYQPEPEVSDSVDQNEPQYNILFIEGPTLNEQASHGKQDTKRHAIPEKPVDESSEKRKVLEEIRRNKTYFEVVKVEDRGTDPWDVFDSKPKIMEDKSMNTVCPTECSLPSCEKERETLRAEAKEKEKLITASLDEGILLLEEVEKIKKHLFNNGKQSDTAGEYFNHKQETSISDYVHLSRTLLTELRIQIIATQKQVDGDIQKLKHELNNLKKEKTEKEAKLRNIERKLEAQLSKVNQDELDGAHMQAKIGKLQDSLEAGKKILKDTEKSLKGKVDRLESELAAQKQSNLQLTQVLDEKSRMITQLESNTQKVENSLEAYKQQLKDIHCVYKSKIAKLDSEHTSKMAALCENQTKANKQLSQALDQSSKYVNQIQEAKKENAMLLAGNNSIQERCTVMEQEMMKAQERCLATERKLSHEKQEVMSLKSQVDKLEQLKEEEILGVDGDIWYQIMYQHDQWILDDLRVSLQEKESNLETLRAKGDCALKDFEKAQNELQQRRQQFCELKDIFLDFEKKRDNVVREQRDFYNKMLLLSKRTIPRDRFFKNLIEECQSKSYRIQELEEKVKSSDKAIEESQKISDAQLKAMQAEMKFTAEKLYEFENQIRVKEMQLQDVIRVFEQEKKNKTVAEEAMNTYKILLEDSKKENAEVRNKLNYLEDLEKNRTNVLKATEELAVETQKRQETERKLKKLEKDFLEMKNLLQSKNGNSLLQPDNENFNKEVEQLKMKIKSLTENKKYMERILTERQKSKELLQKKNEELYNNMRRAVLVMAESKATVESLESKLDRRMDTIYQLEKSQAETEDRLDDLKEVVHEMNRRIDSLHEEREELKDKLVNHVNCRAERAIHQELKSLQRDKAVGEKQHSQEKEILLRRLRDSEVTIEEQHKHLRAFQEQLDNMNAQLRDAKEQLTIERHNHTQQLLTVKKLEMYIKKLEGRLAYETRLHQETSDTMIPQKFLTSSDSYEPPNRDHNKHQYHRK